MVIRDKYVGLILCLY